jgi:hypothetical protein
MSVISKMVSTYSGSESKRYFIDGDILNVMEFKQLMLGQTLVTNNFKILLSNGSKDFDYISPICSICSPKQNS